ncbi:MAG: hypothetical protein DRG11_00340 [Epsilonproteobacteria bacterium]|nr:MAG: hypothetical protein DRG11_00340 [Campylobacterota bacterium]
MRLLISLSLFIFSLCCFVVADYISFDKASKNKKITKITKKITYSTISTQFETKSYKEFVYAQ